MNMDSYRIFIYGEKMLLSMVLFISIGYIGVQLIIERIESNQKQKRV